MAPNYETLLSEAVQAEILEGNKVAITLKRGEKDNLFITFTTSGTFSFWKQLHEDLPPNYPGAQPNNQKFVVNGTTCSVVRSAKVVTFVYPPADSKYWSHSGWKNVRGPIYTSSRVMCVTIDGTQLLLQGNDEVKQLLQAALQLNSKWIAVVGYR